MVVISHCTVSKLITLVVIATSLTSHFIFQAFTATFQEGGGGGGGGGRGGN